MKYKQPVFEKCFNKLPKTKLNWCLFLQCSVHSPLCVSVLTKGHNLRHSLSYMFCCWVKVWPDFLKTSLKTSYTAMQDTWPWFVYSSIHPSLCISGEDFVVSSLFHSPEAGGIAPELSCFLNRCFIARVRCLLDSTSGFLVSGLSCGSQLNPLITSSQQTEKRICIPINLISTLWRTVCEQDDDLLLQRKLCTIIYSCIGIH